MVNKWDLPTRYPVEVDGEEIGTFYYNEKDGMLHAYTKNGGHDSCRANGEDMLLGRLLVRMKYLKVEKQLKKLNKSEG